jgi:hypothetical protein
MIVDRGIAFAAGILERFQIDDMDASTAVSDEAGFLQLAGDNGDAAALHTQPLSHKILRQGQCIALQQISGSQQPSAQPFFQLMQSVAGSNLLNLGGDRLLMAYESVPQCLTLSRQLFQDTTFSCNARAGDLAAGDLANGLIEGNRTVESCSGAMAVLRPNMPASTNCPLLRPTTNETTPPKGKYTWSIVSCALNGTAPWPTSIGLRCGLINSLSCGARDAKK